MDIYKNLNEGLYKNDERDFREDVITELVEKHGFTKHIAETIYSKAYEDGHSAGDHEIYGCVLDLTTFVKDIITPF